MSRRYQRQRAEEMHRHRGNLNGGHGHEQLGQPEPRQTQDTYTVLKDLITQRNITDAVNVVKTSEGSDKALARLLGDPNRTTRRDTTLVTLLALEGSIEAPAIALSESLIKGLIKNSDCVPGFAQEKHEAVLEDALRNPTTSTTTINLLETEGRCNQWVRDLIVSLIEKHALFLVLMPRYVSIVAHSERTSMGPEIQNKLVIAASSVAAAQADELVNKLCNLSEENVPKSERAAFRSKKAILIGPLIRAAAAKSEQLIERTERLLSLAVVQGQNGNGTKEIINAFVEWAKVRPERTGEVVRRSAEWLTKRRQEDTRAAAEARTRVTTALWRELFEASETSQRTIEYFDLTRKNTNPSIVACVAAVEGTAPLVKQKEGGTDTRIQKTENEHPPSNGNRNEISGLRQPVQQQHQPLGPSKLTETRKREASLAEKRKQLRRLVLTRKGLNPTDVTEVLAVLDRYDKELILEISEDDRKLLGMMARDTKLGEVGQKAAEMLIKREISFELKQATDEKSMTQPASATLPEGVKHDLAELEHKSGEKAAAYRIAEEIELAEPEDLRRRILAAVREKAKKRARITTLGSVDDIIVGLAEIYKEVAGAGHLEKEDVKTIEDLSKALVNWKIKNQVREAISIAIEKCRRNPIESQFLSS